MKNERAYIAFRRDLTDEMAYIEREARIQGEADALLCKIDCDDSGWFVTDGNGAVVACGLISCGDAVEEAREQGLTITNMDDVTRWMQPPDDWGIIED